MTRTTLVAALFAMGALAAGPALAQGTPSDTQAGEQEKRITTTTPGDPNKQPLGDQGHVVPPMDKDSAKIGEEGQHPPTKQMGEAVPQMQQAPKSQELTLREKQEQMTAEQRATQ